MESEQSTSSRFSTLPSRVGRHLRTTGAVSIGLLHRRDSLSVFLVVTIGYLFAFLYMMQNVFVDTAAGFGVTVPVADPLSTMFQRGPGPFTYEAIALVELGIITWTFSPLNTALGLGISILVGLNLALTYLAITQPTACGIGTSSGVFASVPALLAGSACCAPVIAIVLGIQMSATLVTVFSWLLPVGVGVLGFSLIYVASKVEPNVV